MKTTLDFSRLDAWNRIKLCWFVLRGKPFACTRTVLEMRP